MDFDFSWLVRNSKVFYESPIERIIFEGFSAEIRLSPALAAMTIEGMKENSILVLKMKRCISMSVAPFRGEGIIQSQELDTHLIDALLGIETFSLEKVNDLMHLKIECFEYMVSMTGREVTLHICQK